MVVVGRSGGSGNSSDGGIGRSSGSGTDGSSNTITVVVG